MENRWKDFTQSWNDRTEQMLFMLPNFSSLLEFGEGNGSTKLRLPGKKYTGSDLYKRNEATIVCDLNYRPLPSFEYHDVILMSGVLEYIDDVNYIIYSLSNYTDIFAISYCCSNNHDILDEQANGWKPLLSYEELVTLFHKTGFNLINNSQWGRQKLFVFKRSK